MPLILEKKIRRDVSEFSRKMGIKEKELVDRALLLYLDSIKKILDMENEFRAWDKLSDEALGVAAKRSRQGL